MVRGGQAFGSRRSSVDKTRNITLGGTTLELHYLGLNHSDSTLVMRLPKEKIVFIVDTIPVGSVPGRGFIDIYPLETEEFIKQVLAMDWERMIPGHPGQPDGRALRERHRRIIGRQLVVGGGLIAVGTPVALVGAAAGNPVLRQRLRPKWFGLKFRNVIGGSGRRGGFPFRHPPRSQGDAQARRGRSNRLRCRTLAQEIQFSGSGFGQNGSG